MLSWALDQIPPDCELFELPSLAERKGSQRLAAVAAIVGEEEAQAAALRAGHYLLDDELTHELLMFGTGIPLNGEIAALSPSRWRLRVMQGLPAHAELVGIVLTGKQRERLLAFLGARLPHDPARALMLAERFFFGDSLKVAVRYTGPRFNQI